MDPRTAEGPVQRIRLRTLARQSLLVLCATTACQSVLAQALYRMTDLGTLGGTNSTGLALNASGQATGNSSLKCPPGGCAVPSHAFVWKHDGKSMQDLGTFGGLFSHGVAINKSGQVAGDAENSSETHAFLWANDGTPIRDLGTLGGSYSYGVGLNDSGQVTGRSWLTGDSREHAFLWGNDGAPMRDLGSLRKPAGNSEGVAVNNAGQVTGQSDYNGTNTYPYHAFLWRNDGTPMQDLGDLGGKESYGVAINSSGQVTGYSATKLQSGYHAFLWRNDGTPMQDIGDLSGHGSYPVAINDAGQVTGNACTKGCAFNHAFLWRNDGTPMAFLGTLGGHDSTSQAMNKTGQVTGSSTLADNTLPHAFLWRNDGTKLQDLNTLIDSADPLKRYVTLRVGHDINDAGQIVADGVDSRTGETHAYFLQGTVLTLLPRSLDFGNQRVNTTSAALSITVTNTSSAAVAITGVTLTGANSTQFARTSNCGNSLAGKASCTIKVTFKPTSAGAKTALVNVNGGGGGLRTVSLKGTGI